MKKYKSLLGFMIVAGLMFSFSLATLVKAEDGDATNSNGGRPAFNKDLQEKRDAFRDDVKEKRDAFKAKMDTERKAFTDDLKTKRDAFMTDLKAKKEEWKNTRTDMKKQFCEKAREMMTKRFQFVITQLEKHQTKVSEIIDKLKADGKNTSLATEALNLSKQKLADAKAKLAQIKALIPEGGCENMTSEIFEQIKLKAREAKDLLKESREALHQAVKELRSLKGEDKNDDSDGDSEDDNTTQ
jgi:hypothetical protein